MAQATVSGWVRLWSRGGSGYRLGVGEAMVTGWLRLPSRGGSGYDLWYWVWATGNVSRRIQTWVSSYDAKLGVAWLSWILMFSFSNIPISFCVNIQLDKD